ncbi:MAG: SUMF1/EgtB/PvdO family nonheme iron enzyme [Lewinellaceae bacterium]|nr:SUMF1/EgtB/PvdO family nonheme iron enzyme [Lewinellaceae bacterium]
MPNQGFPEILPNGHAFEMIFVEGGAFMMGSDSGERVWREDPIHEVELDGFYIGKFSVTQALWKAVMGEDNNPSYFKGANRPVEQVSWEDTQAFFQKLNELSGRQYRLPTEAEWEYAARGGNQSEGYEYAGSNKLKEVAWYEGNSHGETNIVGLKYPNELGIYDMSGNVWEWCQDWFSEDYYEECHKQGKVKNPRGPGQGTGRVLRGGSWSFAPRGCRCTGRVNNGPRGRGRRHGFRMCLSLPSVG